MLLSSDELRAEVARLHEKRQREDRLSDQVAMRQIQVHDAIMAAAGLDDEAGFTIEIEPVVDDSYTIPQHRVRVVPVGYEPPGPSAEDTRPLLWLHATGQGGKESVKLFIHVVAGSTEYLKPGLECPLEGDLPNPIIQRAAKSLQEAILDTRWRKPVTTTEESDD
jgi:hypothetical protein